MRQLAKRTGQSITEAVKQAAAEKLRRMDADYAEKMAITPGNSPNCADRAICKEALHFRFSTTDDDEILGYNERRHLD